MKIDLFRKLCANFNREPNEELYMLWNEQLTDYDDLYIEQAIKNILLKDSYFPTLNRITEEIKNLPSIEINEKEKTKRMEERGVKPDWLEVEVVNQQIDEETENLFEDFNKFLEDFRNEEIIETSQNEI